MRAQDAEQLLDLGLEPFRGRLADEQRRQIEIGEVQEARVAPLGDPVDRDLRVAQRVTRRLQPGSGRPIPAAMPGCSSTRAATRPWTRSPSPCTSAHDRACARRLTQVTQRRLVEPPLDAPAGVIEVGAARAVRRGGGGARRAPASERSMPDASAARAASVPGVLAGPSARAPARAGRRGSRGPARARRRGCARARRAPGRWRGPPAGSRRSAARERARRDREPARDGVPARQRGRDRATAVELELHEHGRVGDDRGPDRLPPARRRSPPRRLPSGPNSSAVPPTKLASRAQDRALRVLLGQRVHQLQLDRGQALHGAQVPAHERPVDGADDLAERRAQRDREDRKQSGASASLDGAEGTRLKTSSTAKPSAAAPAASSSGISSRCSSVRWRSRTPVVSMIQSRSSHVGGCWTSIGCAPATGRVSARSPPATSSRPSSSRARRSPSVKGDGERDTSFPRGESNRAGEAHHGRRPRRVGGGVSGYCGRRHRLVGGGVGAATGARERGLGLGQARHQLRVARGKGRLRGDRRGGASRGGERGVGDASPARGKNWGWAAGARTASARRRAAGGRGR